MMGSSVASLPIPPNVAEAGAAAHARFTRVGFDAWSLVWAIGFAEGVMAMPARKRALADVPFAAQSRAPAIAPLGLIPKASEPTVPLANFPHAANTDAARLADVTSGTETDELVRRAQAGEREAFSELFRKHRGDVSRLVFRMLGHSPDVEDVVQEVFLQVHKSLAEFRGQAKFTTWLHRVTVNVVLMQRRAAKSRPVFAGEAARDSEPDQRLLPDEDAARNQRIVAFRRLLERLAEKKRTVFILHELEGLSPGEIATIVDAPVLTVRTRLFYARRELAEMMRDEPSLAQLEKELASTPSPEASEETRGPETELLHE
jgi:RNA polymerase sigma-70 factor (ECF subfamily)